MLTVANGTEIKSVEWMLESVDALLFNKLGVYAVVE
jgi:hypothetical protein